MPLQHNYANQLSELCTRVKPFPVRAPKLVALNQQLATELGFDKFVLGQALKSSDFTTRQMATHTGLITPAGQAHQLKANTETEHSVEQALLYALFAEDGTLQANSVAQKYGGHQFGHWNPHLGDGRGLLLGELTNQKNQLIDLHLKGAGPTPYSRHADGRAVLRSTIREYLASEALHHLTIPSSRSLAMIYSKEPVARETLESGAMMIRTCPSHLRFGHFEYYFHANEPHKLDALFEYCFEHHFQHLVDTENKYLALLSEICISTAELVAKWQAYGFNHGVMNTDNMSIHGITFDFGPYAFLDDFIPNYICNKSDHEGRYAFNQQPSIALWNLNALAHAFSQKLSMDQLKKALSLYEPRFLSCYQHIMRSRLGLAPLNADNVLLDRQDSQDNALLDRQDSQDNALLDRQDTQENDESKQTSERLVQQFTAILANEFADYHLSFRQLSNEISNIVEGDFSFAAQFKQKSDMLSWCQQYQRAIVLQGHAIDIVKHNMLSINPKFVLRNHLMQNAIKSAENENFEPMHDLLHVICAPFDEHAQFNALSLPPSEEEKGIALSCSS